MKVDLVPIGQVVPYERNPRRNAGAVDKVAASLREYGWRQPIVVDPGMTVIVGHTRLLAAQMLGMTEVPVHVATGLTEAQVKAYRIADNRTGEEAEWDMDLLRLEIDDLEAAGLDPARATGFDVDELASIRLTGDEGLTDPDEVPDVPVEPVTALGDVWVMGRHRLVCGDSTDAEAVARALNGTKPHLMVTDLPYGVEYDANWRNERMRADGSASDGRAIGKVENDDQADWRKAWALFPGEVAYVWCASLHNHEAAESLIASGFQLRSQIIWAKSNFAISRSDYHWQHEPCWYAVRKGGKGWWAGDRKQSTLWQIAKPAKSETGHSTQKPVECMGRPIMNNSSPGQAVYEPFSGSGTTIIAAQMSGRCCLAVELSPAYVDVAVLRWEAFTGEVARLEATGETFADRATVRRTAA